MRAEIEQMDVEKLTAVYALEQRREEARCKTLALEEAVTDKKMRLEGTPAERLNLEVERARLAAEADARAEAAKDAELERLERRLQIEAKYKTPPVAVLPQQEGTPPVPKTVRQIAAEEDFWQTLPNHAREELLSTAGRNARKEQVTPMPDKVKETTPHGSIWEVYAYDVNHHSAVRGVLRRTYADMTKKGTVTKPGAGGVRPRQQGINDLAGFVITVTPREHA